MDASPEDWPPTVRRRRHEGVCEPVKTEDEVLTWLTDIAEFEDSTPDAKDYATSAKQHLEVLRGALDASVARAEAILADVRTLPADLDGIICMESDTRRDLGLPDKPDD